MDPRGESAANLIDKYSTKTVLYGYFLSGCSITFEQYKQPLCTTTGNEATHVASQ
jgi:hypothetical protein